jgi:signal transduction histidine kinase
LRDRCLPVVGRRPDAAVLLAGISDAVSSFDRDWRFVYLNPKAVELAQMPVEDLLGRSLWEAFPCTAGTVLQQELRRAMATQQTVVLEEFGRRAGRWLEHRIFPTPDTLTVFSRDVTERRHAEHTRNALLEVARDLAEADDLDQLLDRAHRRMQEKLGSDVAATFVFDAGTGIFRVAGQRGCPPELAADLTALAFRPFEPFGGRLGEETVIATRDGGPDAVRRLCEHFDWSTVVVAPLQARGRQLGALATMFRDPARVVATWERDLCTGIARQLAVAMVRADAHRSEQTDAVVAAALARLGHQLLSALDRPRLLEQICALTAEATGCATSAIFLWNPEEEAYVPVATYGMLPTRAEEIRLLGVRPAAIPQLLRRLAREEVFAQSDLSPEERAAIPSRLHPPQGAVMLFSAMLHGEQVIGFQVSTQQQIDRPFTGEQMRIARGVVQRAAMAVEHGMVLEQLDRATRLKSDFIAMMSHELRTPLHVILGYGDLLLDGAFGDLDTPVVDALRRMHRSSKDLLELVREMLDLNRLETGRMPVHLSDVDPAELLDDLSRYCADLERAPGVELRMSCASGVRPVETDAAKVVTILRNLVCNALKFTQTGAVEVTASLPPSGSGLCLTVSDTGSGIGPELLPHVFEPFRQGDTRTTRLHGGVGLGLYIVRRMTDALGGQISVDSEPGHGSTFRVTVPDGRAPLLEEHGRLQAVLAITNGEAAVVDGDGTIIAVNDRWLRFPAEVGAATTEHLGIGTNYFTVCARARGADHAVAAEMSRGLREVIDGRRDRFNLDYACDTPTGRWPYRVLVSALDGAVREVLVSHVRLGPAEAVTPR